MLTVEGEEQIIRRLRFLSDDKPLLKVCNNAFRKSARHMRSDIIKATRKRGIIKSLYGRRTGKLQKTIKLGRVRRSIMNLEAPLTSGGLMAIQEVGGRFRPHGIKPKNAPRLVFVTHGKLVATTSVKHPGATHPKMPEFWPAVERSGPQLRRDVAEAVRDHLAAAGRVP